MINSLSEKRAKPNRCKEDAPQKSKKKSHMFFAAIHSFFHSLLLFSESLSLYENIKKAQTLSENKGKRRETYRYFVVLLGWRKPFEVLLQRHRHQQTQKSVNQETVTNWFAALKQQQQTRLPNGTDSSSLSRALCLYAAWKMAQQAETGHMHKKTNKKASRARERMWFSFLHVEKKEKKEERGKARETAGARETQREKKEDSETVRRWGVINRRSARSQSSAHITYLLQPPSSSSSSSSSQESRRLRVWGCPASPDLPRASYPAEFHTYSRSWPSVAVVQLVGKLWSALLSLDKGPTKWRRSQ